MPGRVVPERAVHGRDCPEPKGRDGVEDMSIKDDHRCSDITVIFESELEMSELYNCGPGHRDIRRHDIADQLALGNIPDRRRRR